MRTLIKYLSVLLLVINAACNNQGTDQSKEEQLEQYRQEMADLKIKIDLLEDELQNDSTNRSAKMSQVLVGLKKMEYDRFEHFIEVVGDIEAVQEAYISPEAGGRIKSIHVKEGDNVKAGQLLAKLNTDVTDNAIEELKTQLQLATVVFEKQKNLWDQQIGSEVEYLRAKANKERLESSLKSLQAQLQMAIIKAPISGVVEEVMQKEGELASPGVMMMWIINMNDLYINCDIAESHLPSLNKNEKVFVTFPSWPGLDLRPDIHRIGNAINALNRTVTVTVKVKNTPDHKLKPNLLANLRFMDYESDTALVVPSICIKQDIHGPYLYRLKEDNNKFLAEKVYIETGMVYKNQTLITKGLQPGDQVIVEGYNLVTDESEVRLK